MKHIKLFLFLAVFSSSLLSFGQQKQVTKKVKISGKVVEKVSSQPLEYATISLLNSEAKVVGGGVTSAKGEFEISIASGTYTIKIEFISFQSAIIKDKKLTENTNFGTIYLQEDATQLNEVVVRSEKTTVEIKLDKKVYNVGKDLMVKGGTVSDVLDNIPSVSVDVEGNISLRGNENVKVLIDGRPSNAINVSEALRLIPADAIEKVEIVTNPSARYDAEGGGGILNIILKKGKNLGFNGTFITSTGIPESYGLSGTLNYKSKNYNLFTTQGYAYRNNPGSFLLETTYLNPQASAPYFINEVRDNDRLNRSYNGNFGVELFLDKNTTWTNSFNYRKSKGTNQDNVNYDNYFTNVADNFSRTRVNYEGSASENFEFVSGLVKKFKKEGHKLTVDLQFSKNTDLSSATIIDSQNGTDTTLNDQNQKRNLFQTDYILPLGKGAQFEAGYRGDFLEQTTDVTVYNNAILNTNFTNILEYKEKVNAFYSQYGFKKNKFSFLMGIRWEDSNIDVNQLTTAIYANKRYNNFFPSAFVTYEIAKENTLSISYSRRINRPRGRQLNPFSNYSSNINIFQGNPDINPAMTDALDFGYLKKWENVTLSTSLYANKTSDVFQFVRKESGSFATTIVDGEDIVVNGQVTEIVGGADIRIPVIISTPINLATEYRAGFEFTLNYTPYKWWKLNGNFNFFHAETQGDFSYTNFNNVIVTQNFDNSANSWFARLTSKITLPYKIDWQTNANYTGSQTYAQGKTLGVFSANLAFSKDVLKDKGTIALTISDVLNSRKRLMETNIPNLINSYGEMQWQQRQITVSFTYRFNKQKNDRERQPRMGAPENNDGGGF